MSSARLLPFLLLLVAVGAFRILPEDLPGRPFWLAGAWGLLAAAAVVPGVRWRVLWFNLGIIGAAGFVFEGYTAATEMSAESGRAQLIRSNTQPMYRRDSVLGYRPEPSYSTRERFLFDGELIYDIELTTDAFGLRIGPPPAPSPEQPCLLFFGGSYGWGGAVSNDETMPYRVGIATDGRYAIRNFSVQGYGPHQMLAAIESGFVDEAVNCQPRHTIYFAIAHHALRVAGRWWTEAPGPMYQLAADGSLSLPRPAGEEQASWMDRQLAESALGRRFLANPTATEDDKRLLRAIVVRSRDLLVARYPDMEFSVLYWSVGDNGMFEGAFAASAIPVHNLGPLLPTDHQELSRQFQVPYDGHPNPRAHQMMADYVVEHILRE